MGITVHMDIRTRKAAGSVTGFIDGFGYVGAALAGIFSGLLIDVYSWYAVFYFWVISAVIPTVLMATLRGYKPPKSKYY